VKPRGNNPLPFLINFYKYVPVTSPDRQVPRRSESDGDLFVWLGHTIRVGHPYISAFEGTRDTHSKTPNLNFHSQKAYAVLCRSLGPLACKNTRVIGWVAGPMRRQVIRHVIFEMKRVNEFRVLAEVGLP
jgi:hypothetical protein